MLCMVEAGSVKVAFHYPSIEDQIKDRKTYFVAAAKEAKGQREK